ncbi:IS30 family transposase, partial [Jannaschia sp.]|nr:IS30 family transposase [Jannaschia sp.]
DVSILFRPDTVAHRREFGHWEGDLMLFEQKRGQTNVTSLVERVSRFTVILKNPNKRTKPVMGKIMKAIRDLPHQARRSITFDRGSEFVSWPQLQAKIGTQTWFCDPSSPWQKGTVENTNRRARRWLPPVFVKVVVICTGFHAARLAGPAMGPPPPASWRSASAAPWPLRPASGRSGLSQTEPMDCQLRVCPDHRSGRVARAIS